MRERDETDSKKYSATSSSCQIRDRKQNLKNSFILNYKMGKIEILYFQNNLFCFLISG